MDINTACLVGFTLLFSYIVYASLKPKPSPFVPIRTGLLVAQDTGKTKHNQSKTGDASLSTELVRRRAIQTIGRAYPHKIRETRTQFGSTTGAVESFMITGICPCPACLPYDIIFDGGNQSNEFCEYVGDGSLDAGNETTKACGV